MRAFAGLTLILLGCGTADPLDQCGVPQHEQIPNLGSPSMDPVCASIGDTMVPAGDGHPACQSGCCTCPQSADFCENPGNIGKTCCFDAGTFVGIGVCASSGKGATFALYCEQQVCFVPAD